MSQGQQRRPSSDQAQADGGGQSQEQGGGAVRYGDVFLAVTGGLAEKPVAPQDAATMQSAENLVFGETIKGGPAATMQSAAMRNERMGVVGHDQATDATAEQGVTVSETRVPGGRIVTEFVAGQVVGQYLAPDGADPARGAAGDDTKMTIGEALEAAGYAAGDRPVEHSDAAAIQAAKVRATGQDVYIPGDLAAQAQSAADANLWAARDEEKAKLGDVLSNATAKLVAHKERNATAKLVADKEVESDDAGRVASAETRNKDDKTVRPGGIAASVAAAARLNKQDA
ncbi:late embryogenesis abundant protein D-34-like isoform X1 [Triticum urartu]|uniref:late embryogenesis abundant protein D-34-like isoform X1 n=1 Tax=Triticum urartu TaxID=4572 RepID=UPI00204339C3|nr:late embryogenesis abundant protein D-34-like isoform X1 [Triticum urartu]XP_048573722.1 late embryogenesis abundant protein D-34-like isoform X1 [Triticum urartu]